MDDEELQLKCNNILDDEEIDEEDKTDLVEDLVKKQHPSESFSGLERLVLDILWRHRNGTQVQKKPVLVDKKQSVPLEETARAPLPSDLSKLEKPRLAEFKTQETEDDEDNNGDWSGNNMMSPFDILREVLGEENTDDDIKTALGRNDYDIQRTLNQFVAPQPPSPKDRNPYAYKTLAEDDSGKIMCKYFVQHGECLRADCRYSHDLSSRVCRFWLQGSCLAGESCPFLHEIPMQSLSLDHPPPTSECNPQKPIKLTEDDFPALGAKPSPQKPASSATSAWGKPASSPWGDPSPGWASSPASSPKPKPSFKFNPHAAFRPGGAISPDEFTPAIKQPATSPALKPPASPSLSRSIIKRSKVEIKKPQHIPWKDTEYGCNEEYVSLRHAAAKHGEMRNKYLQLAADNWKKNNAAQAAAMSKKGQSHNSQMLAEYIQAADLLLEQSKEPDSELFLDLHGMTLEESIDRLREVLEQVEKDEADTPRPVYVISSIGHHYARNPKAEDKLTQSVKHFADKHGYELKDFGSDTKFGKVMGIDPWSHYKNKKL